MLDVLSTCWRYCDPTTVRPVKGTSPNASWYDTRAASPPPTGREIVILRPFRQQQIALRLTGEPRSSADSGCRADSVGHGFCRGGPARLQHDGGFAPVSLPVTRHYLNRTALALCLVLGLAITRSWRGPLGLRIALAMTGLIPAAFLALFLVLIVKLKQASQGLR